MTRLLAFLLAGALALWPSLALATVCTTNTVLTPDGKTLICLTCCTNGACTTTCS